MDIFLEKGELFLMLQTGNGMISVTAHTHIGLLDICLVLIIHPKERVFKLYKL